MPEPRRTLNVRITAETERRIDILVEEMKLNKTAVVREAVTRLYYEYFPPQPPPAAPPRSR